MYVLNVLIFIRSQANTVQRKQHSLKEIPVLAILKSIPFLCLILCHFGNLFLLFFYQNTMMIYLTQVLGFNITKGGIAASFPWLGRMLFGFVFSWGADLIKKKKLMTITALRKTATIFCMQIYLNKFFLINITRCVQKIMGIF